MVNDLSDSERGNPLLSHGLLFPISSKGFYIDRIAHTTAFVTVTPIVKHWLEQGIAQWSHHERSIRRPTAPRSYISFPHLKCLNLVQSNFNKTEKKVVKTKVNLKLDQIYSSYYYCCCFVFIQR